MADSERERFTVLADSSALLIEARSTVGPITFGTTSLSGTFEGSLRGRQVETEPAPSGSLAVEVASLRSDNTVYDAEVRRRLNAKRFPVIRADLHTIRPGPGSRYDVTGGLTIHGTTRELTGSVEIDLLPDGSLVAHGEHIIDIRDFDIALPTVLMLRIYPDVTVRFRLCATREPSGSNEA